MNWLTASTKEGIAAVQAATGITDYKTTLLLLHEICEQELIRQQEQQTTPHEPSNGYADVDSVT